ncbi:MAG: hypothetical protein ABI972_15675 [Acidobacteriota bacterium]
MVKQQIGVVRKPVGEEEVDGTVYNCGAEARGTKVAKGNATFRANRQWSIARGCGGKVLRIHRTSNGQVVFKLSGRIGDEQVAELEALINSEARGLEIVLDLKDITLVGQDAVTLLAQCEAGDIKLVNCAPYIIQWIRRQRDGT